MSDLLTRTLQAASVDGILFPVETMDVDGENAFTEFEQFGRDGAELVDAGRKAERGTFTAVMVNGLAGWPDLSPGGSTTSTSACAAAATSASRTRSSAPSPRR